MCLKGKQASMEEQFPIGEHLVDYLEEGDGSVSGDPVVDSWKQADPANENDLEKYQKIWRASTDASVLHKFDTSGAWAKVNSSLNGHQIRVRRLRNLMYAASGMAASLLIILGLAFYTQLFSVSESAISMGTTNGSRSEVVLPDGSVVKLNAGSNLQYHFDKIHKIRKVNFSGEGFFEVSKSTQPFVIETAEGLQVKVLGTKFNLNTYPEDKIVHTTLVEGKVELSMNGAGKLVLAPGQMASFDKESKTLKYGEGDVTHQIGWMQNKLYMDNMSLSEVCTKLERWYDVNISLSDKKLGEKIHYTGVLKEESVTDVLSALSQLSSITYQLKGNNILISEK
jgi:ferric-dicitrate binding protein FerR (iron transport regulator)